MERKEIMPFVFLTRVGSEKFKTSFMSVSLLTQLCRENASANALIPRVLRRGTEKHPDMEKLEARLSELYGARIEPEIRKKGEIQCVGFMADFADDAYIPGGEKLLEPVAELMGELLCRPKTEKKLLCGEYVESEKEKLADEIRGRINDKRSYSVQRLIELMCPAENYGVSRYGGEDAVEEITQESLTERYRELLRTSCVEIFYCGSADFDRVEKAVASAFKELPEAEPDYDLGTDVRMNTVEEKVRYFEDKMNVTQGKLAIGFRMGDCMEEPDYGAMMVFNAIYGGSVNSKLFMNVREKLSLCYFASSVLERHKGVLIVSSGIEFSKYQEALDEIMAQLEAVKNGDFTDKELSDGIKYVVNSLRTVMDSQARTEDFYLSGIIDGVDMTPAELAGRVEKVTAEDVKQIAAGVTADAIYFLRGEDESLGA